MRRNPLYVFDSRDSMGIYNVPMESTVQINDADGQGGALIIQINSKTGLNKFSTVGDLLALPDNYEVPSHVGAVTDEEKGQPGGVAPLDAQGKLPAEFIPAIDINEVYAVNEMNDLLALDTKLGDVGIVMRDANPLNNKTWIKVTDSEGTTVTGDWVEFILNTGVVRTVNGQTGDVTLTTDDVNEGINNKYLNYANFLTLLNGESISELQDVVISVPNPGDVLKWDGNSWVNSTIISAVTSVNGKSGDIILETNDIAESPGDGNKWYKDIYVDQRLAQLIDDAAGVGDTAKVWSADKSATELGLKADQSFVDQHISNAAQQFNDIETNKADVTYVDTGLDTKFDKAGGVITGTTEVQNTFKAHNIGSTGELGVGTNVNGNSALQFNYDGVIPDHDGVLWYDNNETDKTKAFKVDVTAGGDEGYVLLNDANHSHTVAATVDLIPDPTTATTEEVATKVNDIIVALKAAGLMA